MSEGLSRCEVSRELERVGCGVSLSRPAPAADKHLPMPAHCRSKKAWDAIRDVSDKSGVSMRLILSRSRKPRVMAARHLAIREVAKAVDWRPIKGCVSHYWTSRRIGELFGRNHKTVLWVLGRVPGWRQPVLLREMNDPIVITQRGRGEP